MKPRKIFLTIAVLTAAVASSQAGLTLATDSSAPGANILVQSIGDNSFTRIGSGAGQRGQTFLSGAGMVIDAITIRHDSGGQLPTAAFTFTLQIWDITGLNFATQNVNEGTLLTGQDAAVAASIISDGDFITLTFDPPITVTAGRTLALDFDTDAGTNLQLEMGKEDPFTDGVLTANYDLNNPNAVGADFRFYLQGEGSSTSTTIITTPTARQVIQRDSGTNTASIPISGTHAAADSIEARVLVMAGNGGTSTDWTTIVSGHPGGTFASSLSGIAAGGWYQLELRGVTGGLPDEATILERIGVGDVFIIAGQSNSANFGFPAQTVVDDRVSAIHYATGEWSKATDPLPGAGTGANKGSPWTRLGDLITAQENIPVAFMSIGVGGTEVIEWTPGSAHYPRLTTSVQRFSPMGFRAILWHQGERDSFVATPTADYESRLNSTIAQSRLDAAWEVPWYVAEVGYNAGLSTLERELRVVAAQWRVIHGDPLVLPGASTDDFHLEGKLVDQVHFNAAGLTDHAQQWMEILYSTPTAAPKNGDFENNVALADGTRHTIDTGASLSPSVIAWRTLATSGEDAAIGSSGYYNPDESDYPGAGDTSPAGGVLPNMDGRHVAYLSGNASGTHFLQTRRHHLSPGRTYTCTVAFGVRSSGIFAGAQLDLLANGTIIGSRTVTKSDLDTLADGDATGLFTDVSLAVTTTSALDSGQPITIRISKVDGAGTDLDFDNVRLISASTPFASWQIDHWNDTTDPAAAWEANPDGDSFANGIEYHLGLDPTEHDAPPLPSISEHSGKTWATYTVPLNPTVDSTGLGLFYSFDLETWIPASTHPEETVVETMSVDLWQLEVSTGDHPSAFFRLQADAQPE